jgi:hypothetical protein
MGIAQSWALTYLVSSFRCNRMSTEILLFDSFSIVLMFPRTGNQYFRVRQAECELSPSRRHSGFI